MSNIFILPRLAIAVYDIPKASVSNGLTCKAGEIFMIYQEHKKGWAQAENMETKARGFIPLTYVSYLKKILKSEKYIYEDSESKRYKFHQYKGDTYVQNTWELSFRNEGAICLLCATPLTTFDTRYHADQIGQSWTSESVCEKCYINTPEVQLKNKFKLQYDVGKKLIEMKRHPGELHFMVVAGSVAETLDNAFHAYWDRYCFGERVKDANGTFLKRYKYITYGKCYERISNFGKKLRKKAQKDRIKNKIPINKRTFVGICGNNSINWFVADLAVLHIGGVSVPIQRTKVLLENQEDIIHIINNAELQVIVCEHIYTEAFIKLKEHCPSILRVIQMEKMDSQRKKALEAIANPLKVKISHMKNIEQKGAEKSDIPPIPTPPHELLSIVYTSGSTGRSKGAIMTDLNVKNSIVKEYWAYHPLTSITYSPLSHISDRLNTYCTLVSGGTVGIYSGDMSRIFEDFQLIKPVSLSSTPRLFNRIYKIYQDERLLKSKFEGNVNDEHLYEKIRQLLGNRIVAITAGGAPTSPHILEFLKKAFKCPVFNGYASTEAGSVFWLGESSSLNGKMKVFDHVQVKLRSVPELGYLADDTPARGEICIKSPDVISGYYRQPEITKEAFDDEGYFKSGDIGERDSEGNIRIIDRIKNIFKLAQGEYVTPEPLENVFLKSPFVDQIFIYGDSLRSYVVAVVVPNITYVKQWFKLHPELNSEDFVENDQLKGRILSDFEKIATKAGIPEYECPKGILLEKSRFTVENLLMTGPSKICRPSLTKKYKNDLIKLYQLLEDVPEEDLFTQIICDQLDLNTKNIDQLKEKSFKELGGDSMKASKVNGLLIENNIQVPPDMLMSETFNINNLVDYIKEQFNDKRYSMMYNARYNTTSMKFSFNDVFAMPSFFSPAIQKNQTLADSKNPKHVFFTGITGFLGATLYFHLSKTYKKLNPDSNVIFHCLVRARDLAHAEERVLEQLSKVTKLDKLPRNIKCYVGDLSSTRIGLPDKTCKFLRDCIDIFYHVGAVVNAAYPLKDIYHANIFSTLYLADIALSGKKRSHFHFISTISVLGDPSSYHPDLPTDDNAFHKNTKPIEAHQPLWKNYAHFMSLGGYAQSKFIAETLLSSIKDEYDFKYYVHRPGLIAPSLINGYVNDRDWLFLFLKGCITAEKFPQFSSTQYLHVVSVDSVSRMITDISIDAPEDHVFHLVHPSFEDGLISLTDLYHVLLSFDNKIKLTPFVNWFSQLSPSNPLFPYKGTYAYGFPSAYFDSSLYGHASIDKHFGKFEVSPTARPSIYGDPFFVQQMSAPSYLAKWFDFMKKHQLVRFFHETI